MAHTKARVCSQTKLELGTYTFSINLSLTVWVATNTTLQPGQYLIIFLNSRWDIWLACGFWSVL